MMGKAIANISELAFLDILLDRVQRLFFADLSFVTVKSVLWTEHAG